MSGPVSSQLVRDRATLLAQALGWVLTVDAFASETNSLLPRFFASYEEPLAEFEDAFAIGDWDSSLCKADSARAILVTPLAVSAPYW